MKKLLSVFIAVFMATAFAFQASASEQVNVYTYQKASIIKPIFDEFTKETGIKVHTIYVRSSEAIDKLVKEGELSPADIVLLSDIGRITELSHTEFIQPVESEEMNANIPAQYRDVENRWFALTIQARVLYMSHDRVEQPTEEMTYADLAKPEWEDRVCMRRGHYPYNVSLIASMIAHKGTIETKEWLEGVKNNLVRKPQGNDTFQVKTIKEEECDITLGNSNNFGQMLNDPAREEWAESVDVYFPNQNSEGAHINVSGMLMAKYAPNKENAKKLMTFLSGDVAQQMLVENSDEFPVKQQIEGSELTASWGELKFDTLPFTEIVQYREAAIQLLSEVGWDQ